MIFARFIAVLLLLYGVGPAFLFGVWRPGGWFLICLAIIYGLLSTGLWQGWRWALPVALALSFSQFVVVSSSWFSWRFLVFASRGFGLSSAPTILEMQVFTAHSFGCCVNFAFGYNQPLLADYAGTKEPSFVFFNVLALPLVVLLLAFLGSNLYSAAFPPMPNQSLQRTAG